MSTELRDCPKCGARMEYRLGEYDCPACGYIEQRKPPEQAAEEKKSSFSGPGFRREQYGGQPTNVPPPTQFSVLRSEREPESGDRNSLGREKVLFLTIYFFFQLGSSLIFSMQYGGATEGIVSLPGLLIGAVFYTLGAAFVLYFDNDGLRQCCMWTLGPVLILATWSVIMAFATEQGGLTISLIPTILMSIWLFTILMRDVRSG